MRQEGDGEDEDGDRQIEHSPVRVSDDEEDDDAGRALPQRDEDPFESPPTDGDASASQASVMGPLDQSQPSSSSSSVVSPSSFYARSPPPLQQGVSPFFTLGPTPANANASAALILANIRSSPQRLLSLSPVPPHVSSSPGAAPAVPSLQGPFLLSPAVDASLSQASDETGAQNFPLSLPPPDSMPPLSMGSAPSSL